MKNGRLVSETIHAELFDKKVYKFLSNIESSGGDMFSWTIISDFIYGDENGGYLPNAVDEIGRIDQLSGWTETQWVDLLRK